MYSFPVHSLTCVFICTSLFLFLMQDENVLSDDDDENDDGRDKSEDANNDEIEEDDGRHARMLQGITGMPSEAFEGKVAC